jgi:hypothetical protein
MTIDATNPTVPNGSIAVRAPEGDRGVAVIGIVGARPARPAQCVTGAEFYAGARTNRSRKPLGDPCLRPLAMPI